MKKLILAVAVVVSNFVFTQDNQLKGFYHTHIFDPSIDSTYLFYKDDDHDAQQVYGILKNIFLDNNTYKMYESVNPRILGLIVNTFVEIATEDFEKDDVIMFNEWLSKYGGKTNFENQFGNISNYEFQYKESHHSESLYVVYKQTNDIKLRITLIYDKFEDLNSTNWINLGRIDIEHF